METKDDLLSEICDSLGIEIYQTTVGSSIPRRFFSDLLDTFELQDEGDAVSACKQILSKAGQNWEKEFSSESTPSGGGGTITLAGLKALRNAVSLLLDEIEFEANQTPNSLTDPQIGLDWTLLRGQRILRKKLHDIYGGIRQGGISPSTKTNNVFLFSDDAANHEHGYERDYWEDDVTFIYCGDGQSGNQKLSGRNGTIHNHIQQGRRLRLFSPVSGEITYQGELEIDLDDPFVIKRGTGRDGKERDVVMFRLKRILVVEENLLNQNKDNSSVKFGISYRQVEENISDTSGTNIFERDPNLLDRALRSHAITQNIVANWVAAAGLIPLSPTKETCDFDIAWNCDSGRVVCEVKSLTDENEIHQFRLGLGQVLEYAHSLSAFPLLVFSKAPRRTQVVEIARNSGVGVLWPEVLSKYSPRDIRNLRHK